MDGINRRRFVTLTGTVSILSTVGCIGGGDEQPPDEGRGGDDNGNGGGDDQAQGEEQEQEPEEETDEQFDFPPGADDGDIVTETVVAGARQRVAEAGRYRVEQVQELDYSDAPREELEFTYDVAEDAVHERMRYDAVELDRWVTSDRTVARFVDTDADRTSRWRTDTAEPGPDADSFEGYPFEATAVPALLESASFEFEEIESDGDQPLARYAGELGRAAFELPQPKGSRTHYQLDSIAEGRVTLWLAESGSVHAVDYGFAGEATRLTHEGREAVGIEADGQVQFTYDGGDADTDLEDLSRPEWAASAESADVREFGLTETSLGQTYKLLDGPPLPGSVELEYAEFYLTAHFDDERYTDRYIPRTEFDDRAGVVARFDEGELTLEWASMSGRDALVEADRIEMSIYLYKPGESRFMVFHEEYYP